MNFDESDYARCMPSAIVMRLSLLWMIGRNPRSNALIKSMEQRFFLAVRKDI